jgi:hypothetical protein
MSDIPEYDWADFVGDAAKTGRDRWLTPPKDLSLSEYHAALPLYENVMKEVEAYEGTISNFGDFLIAMSHLAPSSALDAVKHDYVTISSGNGSTESAFVTLDFVDMIEYWNKYGYFPRKHITAKVTLYNKESQRVGSSNLHFFEPSEYIELFDDSFSDSLSPFNLSLSLSGEYDYSRRVRDLSESGMSYTAFSRAFTQHKGIYRVVFATSEALLSFSDRKRRDGEDRYALRQRFYRSLLESAHDSVRNDVLLWLTHCGREFADHHELFDFVSQELPDYHTALPYFKAGARSNIMTAISNDVDPYLYGSMH